MPFTFFKVKLIFPFEALALTLGALNEVVVLTVEVVTAVLAGLLGPIGVWFDVVTVGLVVLCVGVVGSVGVVGFSPSNAIKVISLSFAYFSAIVFEYPFITKPSIKHDQPLIRSYNILVHNYLLILHF